jgi:AraC-like DNA-binding protein
MQPIIHLEHINDMLKLLPQLKARHPLVAVVDFGVYKEQLNSGMRLSLGFYAVMFKNHCVNRVRYGQQTFDFQDGSLMCIAPRQVITLDDPSEVPSDIAGWGLFFHPDLIRSSGLGKEIKDYSYFSYESKEALHLSDKEKSILGDIVQKIDAELSENIDKHSLTLLVSNIALLLNYCSRYYDRQFITRKHMNKGVVAQVEEILSDYFRSTDPSRSGLPSVKYLADKVHFSPNYLSDLLKKETGMNTQEVIHRHLIEAAKTMLKNSDQTVGELAFSLGFEYPQYFSRLFKQKTGMTPLEYRNLN